MASTLRLRLSRFVGKNVYVVFGSNEFALGGTLVDLGHDHVELDVKGQRHLVPFFSVHHIRLPEEEE